MYTIPPKKMIIINILNILKKYSDMDHRLTGQEIMEYLKKEYYMDVDRKTVKRNLMNLLDLDCGIDYEEITRIDNKGKETSICTNWYIQREFDDSELRLIIDSLLFSNVPQSQCKSLIEKLKGLSNIYFDKKVKHICNMPENPVENKELFYTVDVLDEAISKKKKVAFTYNSYGVDKKLHPKREKEYVVSPYQMAATNGRYYLICNSDSYNTLANYRIDRITKIRLTDMPVRPMEELDEKLDLPVHMAEHLYMHSGESVRVKFKAEMCIIDQVVDWFGKDVKIEKCGDNECMVEVYINKKSFFYWAMQYGMHVEVIEPIDVREKIIEAVEMIGQKYNLSKV